MGTDDIDAREAAGTRSELFAQWDELTVAQLRAKGAMKWSMYPDRIGAFVAEMDFPVAQPILDALHGGVEAQAFGYLPAAMSGEMSVAFADFARERYGWQPDPADVHPAADVIAGLTTAIEYYSTPGSAVVVPTPAYMPFLTVPGQCGRDVIEVPLVDEGGRYSYDLEALERALAIPGQLLVLCNPHNPVGRVLARQELLAIAEVVDRCGARVFADEIHAPLVYPGSTHIPYASLNEVTAGHTITAASASKAWNTPGLKCAQIVVSNPADAQIWSQAAGVPTEHGAANLGVVAATAAYRHGAQWLSDVLDYLDGSRKMLGDLISQHIPGVRYVPPEGTYLAWLDCRDLGLGPSPADFFYDHADVALIDGARCGEAGRGFVRYNFATPRPIMEQTIAAMGRALDNR